MNTEYQYILVDDSEFDLYLNREFLEMSGVTGTIISFDSALDALHYIMTEGATFKSTVILLDIHMPLMNGFEFLDKFVLFPEFMRKNIIIFMISSTLDMKDIQKAKDNPLVADIMSKPLNAEMLLTKISQLQNPTYS